MTDAGLFSTVPCLVSTVSRVGEVAPKSRTVSCSSVNLASANNTCLSASCTRGCLCRSLEYAYFITDDFPCPFPYLMQHPGRLGLLDCLEMHHAAPPVSTLGAVVSDRILELALYCVFIFDSDIACTPVNKTPANMS
ncbi:hypothetical protein HRR84_005468 [Exophiala dermatitidis]|nr:hypothetical protein HRR84_005468 [Exophiala dermatitidis]